MWRSARRDVWWQLSNLAGLRYNFSVEEIDNADRLLGV
jgi:hypothetical protein